MTNTYKSTSKHIGLAIAKRRTELAMTQDQVAEKLGIGYEAVSRIERGISEPTVSRLFELADVFECGIEELLAESSPRAEDQSKRIAAMLNQLSEQDREM